MKTTFIDVQDIPISRKYLRRWVVCNRSCGILLGLLHTFRLADADERNSSRRTWRFSHRVSGWLDCCRLANWRPTRFGSYSRRTAARFLLRLLDHRCIDRLSRWTGRWLDWPPSSRSTTVQGRTISRQRIAYIQITCVGVSNNRFSTCFWSGWSFAACWSYVIGWLCPSAAVTSRHRRLYRRRYLNYRSCALMRRFRTTSFCLLLQIKTTFLIILF